MTSASSGRDTSNHVDETTRHGARRCAHLLILQSGAVLPGHAGISSCCMCLGVFPTFSFPHGQVKTFKTQSIANWPAAPGARAHGAPPTSPEHAEQASRGEREVREADADGGWTVEPRALTGVSEFRVYSSLLTRQTDRVVPSCPRLAWSPGPASRATGTRHMHNSVHI